MNLKKYSKKLTNQFNDKGVKRKAETLIKKIIEHKTIKFHIIDSKELNACKLIFAKVFLVSF